MVDNPHWFSNPDLAKFQPSHKGAGSRLRGANLTTFTESKAKEALDIWGQISTRSADLGRELAEDDYREFTQRVGMLGQNALRLGINWSKSENPLQRNLGDIIVMSQSLNPILASIDKLKEAPGGVVDAEGLIQEGLIRSWEVFNKLPSRGNISRTLTFIGDTTYKLGEERKREEVVFGFDSLSAKEFEQAKFDPIADAEREIERTELLDLIQRSIAPVPGESGKVTEKTLQPEPIPGERLQDLEAAKKPFLIILRSMREKYGALAAVVALTFMMSLGYSIAENIQKDNQIGIGFHNGKNPGISVGWREAGPINTKESIWLGDNLPLVPTQVITRKFIDISLRGISQDQTQVSQAVVRRNEKGQVIPLAHYINS